MLLLPPQASPRHETFTGDIEDLGRDEKEREGMLIEELVIATPRVAVDFSESDTLCPKCRQPCRL